MAEYIDREKLIKRIQYTKMSAFVPNCDEPIISDAVYKQGQAIKKIITEFRAADVVKVVRCKDCVHSRPLCFTEKKLYNDDCVGCTKISTSYHSVIMNENDFCSYGERKEVTEK